MNLAKTLFAQLMEFVPWTSFARIVAHYGGVSKVRSWADLAALLIRCARKLYCNDSFGINLDNTVYVLDRGYLDSSRLLALHQAGHSSHLSSCQTNTDKKLSYSLH